MYSFVYHQGDIGDSVYFVLKGNVLVHQGRDTSKLDRKHRERARRESIQQGIRDGGSFGEDVVVSKTGVRVESARALVNSNLYTLSKGEIENIMSMLGPGARIMFLERLLKRDLAYEGEDEESDSNEEEEYEFKVSDEMLTPPSLMRKKRGENYDTSEGLASRNTLFEKSLEKKAGKWASGRGGRARLSSNDHETNLESPNSILHTPNEKVSGPSVQAPSVPGERRRTAVTKGGESKHEGNEMLMPNRRGSKVIEADPKMLRKQFAKKMMSAQSEKNFMIKNGLSFEKGIDDVEEEDEEDDAFGLDLDDEDKDVRGMFSKRGGGLGEDGMIVEGSKEDLNNNFMNMMVKKRFTNVEKIAENQDSFKLDTKMGGLGVVAGVLKGEEG
jgi:hypothetical protein